MRYLKTFLLAAVVWGSGMYGFMSGDLVDIFDIDYGSRSTIILTLIPMSLAFAGMIVAFLYYFDSRRLKQGVDKHGDQLRPTESFVLDYPLEDAVPSVKAAMSSLHKARFKPCEGTDIECITGMTLRSFGEVVTAAFKTVDDQSTVVTIQSRSRLPGTFVDYGINSDNLATIKTQLTNSAPESTT